MDVHEALKIIRKIEYTDHFVKRFPSEKDFEEAYAVLESHIQNNPAEHPVVNTVFDEPDPTE